MTPAGSECRDVGPSLPAAGFRRLRINALVRVRCFHCDRSLLLDAAFHSPAATADLSIRLRSQVNAPGLHLRSNSKIYVQPVRLRAPAPGWLFYGHSRRVHRAKPAAWFLARLPYGRRTWFQGPSRGSLLEPVWRFNLLRVKN
jgi:hypothetical protein